MKEFKPIQPMCAFGIGNLSPAQLTEIHPHSRHPGFERTLYFARKINLSVSKAAVRSVVRSYEECQSIDPAPV